MPSEANRETVTDIRELVHAYPGPASVYVQDLRSGRGAAWNALARHQAASTLKLGIALEVLRVLPKKPAPGTHGHGLTSVQAGDTTLEQGTANRITASAALSFVVSFQNQGESCSEARSGSRSAHSRRPNPA